MFRSSLPSLFSAVSLIAVASATPVLAEQCAEQPAGTACGDGDFCNGAETCSGGTCVPGTLSPCSICTPSNCQLPPMVGGGWPSGASGAISDLTTPPHGTVAADDFVPSSGTLSSVCVWGFYHDGASPDLACIGSVDDEFRVRIFADNGNLPGVMIGESMVTGTNISRGHEPGTLWEAFYGGGGPGAGALAQGYTLILDVPITGMIADGRRYWLEVANNTTGSTAAAKTCWWSWMQSFGNPEDGEEKDGYSAAGAGTGGTDDPATYLQGASRYFNGSGRNYDLAFCLGTGDSGAEPLPFTAVTPTGACWSCPGDSPTVCSVETMANCADTTGLNGIWNKNDPSCSGTVVDVWDSVATSCNGVPWPGAGDARLVSTSLPTCGDGILDSGEQCDPASGTLPTATCDVDCQFICPLAPWSGGDCWGGANDGLWCQVGDDCPDGVCMPYNGSHSLLTEGLAEVNSVFSGADGSSQVTDENGLSNVGHDSWFHYETTCTGRLIVSACATGPGVTKRGFVNQDSLLALYHNDELPGETFVCPGANDSFQSFVGSNEACNGIRDAGPGILTRLVTPGEKWTIRLTNWGETSATAGAGSQIIDVACIGDVCPIAAPPSVHQLPDAGGVPRDNKKGRMLAVIVDEPRVAALQVEFVSLPPPYDLWNGAKMFARPPIEICEGSTFPVGPCFVDTYTTSMLECTGTPFSMDWNALGVVNLWHEGIVPGGTYNIRVVDAECDLSQPASYSQPTEMETAVFGDTVGIGSFQYPANGAPVGIDDALAGIATFSNSPNKPSKSRTELASKCITHTADIDDVLMSLSGFTGENHPQAPVTADACAAISICTEP